MKTTSKISFFVMFFVLGSLFFSQTHRLYYISFSKRYKEMKGHYKENIITDINKTTVKSYAEEFIIRDSINKKDKSGNMFFASPYFVERSIRNLKTGITTNYGNNLGAVYSYETQDKMDWKIHPETKEINGYKAQKATITFEGRNWEAWFTEQINIPYGPYKFYGLPGLILEMKDDKKDYIFTFAQNKTLEKEYDTSGFLEKYYGKSPVKITLKDIHTLKMNYYLDPFKEFKAGKMENHHLGKEEEEVINYNEKTKKIQQELRLENPIDLQNSVKYPEK